MSTVLRRLTLSRLGIPFKTAFRHASAERAETSSLWVEAVSDDGVVGYGESCPRSYVTGETLASARDFFLRHRDALCAEVDGLDALQFWVDAHAEDLDADPAAWCAIELAILDLLAKHTGKTVEAILGLPPLSGRFRYTAVLGDAGSDAFRSTLERYLAHGFNDFKLKLSGDAERDRDKIRVLRVLASESIRVRVDANNLWEDADDAIAFLCALDYPFFAVEEPIRPNRYAELARIAEALDCRIVLDESFLRIGQLAELADTAATWLLNLRVSKLGGLLRSLRIVEAARALKIGLIVGAQVGETSLLTRAGLTVAHAAGEALTAQEGAFGTHLLERDLCEPPLMFGAAGVLDTARFPFLRSPGFGLDPSPPADVLRALDNPASEP